MESFMQYQLNGRVKGVQIRKMRELNQFVDAFRHHEAKISHILDIGRVVKYASRNLTYEEYNEFCLSVGIEDKHQHMLKQIGEITEETGCRHLRCRIALALCLWRLFFIELE